MAETRSLQDLKQELHSKLLEVRNTQRFVDSLPFEEAYQQANETERAIARSLIEKHDRTGLSKWVKTQLANDLESLSMRELRARAQQLGVKDYNHKTKTMLIRELQSAA